MIIDDQIKNGKLQYYVNREAAKISALSSGKLVSMNISQVKKYYLLIKKIIEKAKLKKQQVKCDYKKRFLINSQVKE